MTNIRTWGWFLSLGAVCGALALGAGAVLDWGETAKNNFWLLQASLMSMVAGLGILFLGELQNAVRKRILEAFLANVFTVVLALGIGFALVDWFVGVSGLSQSPFGRDLNVDLRRSHVPYLSFKGQPSNAELGHNQHGYRGPDPSLKETGEFSVLVFGGSTVWAGDPPLSELWTQMAHRHGRANVRFYNLGVVSSVAHQDVARALLEGLRFDPDMLIMYNGGNDAISPVWQDPRPGYPYDYYVWESNPYLSDNPGLTNLLRSLLANTNTGRFMLQSEGLKFATFGLFDLREEVGHLSAEWISNIARTYLESQRYIQEASARMGIQTLTIFQPVRAYEKDSRYPEIAQVRQDVVDLLHKEYSDLVFLDLSLMFAEPGNRAAFTDIIHVTQEAKDRIVEASYPFIEGRLPSRSGRNGGLGVTHSGTGSQ